MTFNNFADRIFGGIDVDMWQCDIDEIGILTVALPAKPARFNIDLVNARMEISCCIATVRDCGENRALIDYITQHRQPIDSTTDWVIRRTFENNRVEGDNKDPVAFYPSAVWLDLECGGEEYTAADAARIIPVIMERWDRVVQEIGDDAAWIR